jgi:hypothetical protein
MGRSLWFRASYLLYAGLAYAEAHEAYRRMLTHYVRYSVRSLLHSQTRQGGRWAYRLTRVCKPDAGEDEGPGFTYYAGLVMGEAKWRRLSLLILSLLRHRKTADC